MDISCHIHNCVSIRPSTKASHYEMQRERNPSMKYFQTFGRKCYIIADREQRHKLDPKIDEGIFSVYSTNSWAYREFNNRTRSTMESIIFTVDEIQHEVGSK